MESPRQMIPIHKAASTLFANLRNEVWFKGITLGHQVIFVDAYEFPPDFKLRNWEGYGLCLTSNLVKKEGES